MTGFLAHKLGEVDGFAVQVFERDRGGHRIELETHVLGTRVSDARQRSDQEQAYCCPAHHNTIPI